VCVLSLFKFQLQKTLSKQHRDSSKIYQKFQLTGAKPGGVLRGVLFQMLFYTHESLQSAGITVSAGKTIGQTSTAEQQMTAKRYFFSKVKFLVSTLRRTMETLALIMFVMVSQIQDMIEFLQQNPALQNLSLSLPSSVSSPSGRISKVNLLHLLKVLKSYLLQAQWEIRSNLEELGPAPTNKSPYFVKGMNPFTKEPLELRSTGLSGSVDESVRPFSIRQSRPSLAGVTPAQTSGMGVTADQTPRVQCFRECVSADFDAMVDDDDDDDSTDSDSDDEEDDSSASGADSVRPSAFEREFKGQVVDSSTRDSRRQTNSGSKWTQWWPPECADNEYPRTNNMSMWPKESKDAKKKDSKDGNKNDAKKKREEAQKQALLEKKNVEKRKLNKIGPKVTTKGEKVPFFETLFANTTWFKTMNASQSEVNAYRKGWTYGNMYFRRFFEGKRKTSFFRNDLAENFWKKDMRKMMMVDSRSAGSSVAAAVSSSAAASSSSAPNGSVVPLPRGSAAAVAPPPGLIFTSTHSLTIQQSMRRGYVTMSEVKPVSGVRPILKNSSSKNSRDSENERKSRWSSLKKGAARKLKRKRTPTSPKSDSSRCSDTRRPSTPPRGTGTSQAVQNKAVEKARKERKENKDKRKKVRKFSQDAQTGGYVTQEPIFNNDCSLVNNGNLLLATNNKFQYLEKKAAKDMKKKCQSYLDDHGKLRNFGVMALRQLSFDSNGAITEFPEVKSMDVLSFGVQKGKEELYTR